MVENPPANAGEVRDAGSIPGSGRSPGGGRGNPLQYSCLENPMDRGTWWATGLEGRKGSDATEATWHAHVGMKVRQTLTVWYESDRKEEEGGETKKMKSRDEKRTKCPQGKSAWSSSHPLSSGPLGMSSDADRTAGCSCLSQLPDSTARSL